MLGGLKVQLIVLLLKQLLKLCMPFDVHVLLIVIMVYIHFV